MWENLLILSTADNGGPIYQSGAAGANNWPMRGGKMSNWQVYTQRAMLLPVAR